MGVAKATLLVEGEPLAQRAARLLLDVCDPVLEVGPGYTALPAVVEDEPGAGPLAALVAGADALGAPASVVLLACDHPFVTATLLAELAHWPGTGTVVPLDAEGVLQPTCARYSAAAVGRARDALRAGARSLRAVLDGEGVVRFAPDDSRALVDVDTPEEAARWGVQLPGSLAP
jgi:molybdopterin-guanine dinucleotide biosynthesis protein A